LGLIFWLEKGFKIHDWKSWVLRGVFGSCSMVTCYWAIQITSSGRAVLLSNTYPLFVALYGFLFFHEKISWNRLAALVICFSGILLVFYDNAHSAQDGHLFRCMAATLPPNKISTIKI
jgi:drug/metabolite transporter (DMT)-like permease